MRLRGVDKGEAISSIPFLMCICIRKSMVTRFVSSFSQDVAAVGVHFNSVSIAL